MLPTSRRLDGPGATSAGSQDVLDRNAAAVGAFVFAQRQNVACSGNDLHKATLQGREVDVHYLNQFGREVITVEPKPQPVPVEEPPQPALVYPPNDLVTLAAVEVVTPQFPVFMLVLYGLDGWALLDMTDPGNPTLVDKGVASKTNWSNGQRLPTLQLKLGDTQFVMLPLDLTGQVSAAHYYLSTNALGDNVETQAPTNYAPIMAGDPADLIYSTGGAYAYSSDKGFQFAAALYTENGGGHSSGDSVSGGGDSVSGGACPVAIDNDGTCYFQPTLNHPDSLVVDDVRLQYGSVGSLSNDLYNAIQAVGSNAPTLYFPGVAAYFYSTFYHDSHGVNRHVTQEQTAMFWYAGIGFGTPGPALTSTYYFGAGVYGQRPSLQGFDWTEGTTDTLGWDAGNPVASIHTSVSRSSVIKGGVPTQYFEKLDKSYVNEVEFSGVHLTVSTLTSKGYVVASTIPQGGSGTGSDFIPIDTAGNGTTEYFSVYGGFNNPAYYNSNPKSKAIADAAWQDCLSYSAKGSVASTVTPMYTLTLDYTDDATQYSIDAEYASASAVPPYLLNSINGVTSVAYGNGSGVYIEGYSSLHMSITLDTDSSRQESYSLTLGTVQFSASGRIAMHNFPPRFSGGLFYTFTPSSDGTQHSVVTPYGTFAGHADEPFGGWLHISNGTLFVQGFAVDGTPHLYANGKADTDLAPVIADLLKVGVADIVTCLLDITRAKAQALAHVQPPQL